jgi:hypothetical protein
MDLIIQMDFAGKDYERVRVALAEFMAATRDVEEREITLAGSMSQRMLVEATAKR